MAQLTQLLLFDPDPSGLDTLSYGFEKEGCSVTATSDANKARELIQSASPPLVVVNFRESDQVALDLLRATTSNPRTRNVPCVAMGRVELRAAALGAGAFVFLGTPLFVRDVLGACRLVVAASVPGSRPSPDTELSLDMEHVEGVYFLVRSLAASGRSTAIELRRGPTRGDLRFIDGTLTSAQVGPVQGLPALHQLLLWQTASLKFRFKNVVRRGSQLAMKSGEVIEECDRFLRDFAHEVKDLGFARTVYRGNGSGPVALKGIPSEVVPVLKLFDGQRDLSLVLEASPFRVFDTLKIIKRFAAGKAIVPVTALPARVPDTGAGISGPAALDFWFQRRSSQLGAEIGLGRRAESLRANVRQAAATAARPAPSAGRPVVPFPAVASGPLGVASRPAAAVRAEIPLRARTATRKNGVELAPHQPPFHDAAAEMVTPPPVLTPPPTAETPRPEASPMSATPRPEPATAKAALPSPMTALFPAPIPLSAASSAASSNGAVETATPPAVAASEVIGKPAPAVATGEIKAIPSRRPTGSVPVLGAPTVLVELGPLPAPVPMGPTGPAPVTAAAAAQIPSVIVAALTPAPVLTPPVSPALAAPVPAPPTLTPPVVTPSVVVRPIATPPVVAPPAPVPTPAPRLDPEPPAPVAAVETSTPRTPSDNFNALESDFFEREADLYKRESVENFDDLDKGHPRANGRNTRRR